jgi:hypothetical protein
MPSCVACGVDWASAGGALAKSSPTVTTIREIGFPRDKFRSCFRASGSESFRRISVDHLLRVTLEIDMDWQRV